MLWWMGAHLHQQGLEGCIDHILCFGIPGVQENILLLAVMWIFFIVGWVVVGRVVVVVVVAVAFFVHVDFVL
jgi:hypothetical protein